jgi:hypothetical protein
VTVALLGSVSNNYSNFLSLLAIDAAHAASYRGPGPSGTDGDFGRALAVADDKTPALTVGKGQGLVVEIGGCGSSDVFRTGDTLVMVEHYTGDDDAEIEADLHRSIVELPTKRPRQLGTVEVKSGVLALVALVEAGGKPPAKLAAGKAKEMPWGMCVGVAPGRYEIWSESLEAEGDWGTIGNRIRIVAAGTPVVKGKPVVEVAKPVAGASKTTASKAGASNATTSKASGSKATTSKATPSKATTSKPTASKEAAGEVERFLVGDKWIAIESLVVAPDGRVFAGENGAAGVCAWDANGTVRWRVSLAKPRKGGRHEIALALAGDTLYAQSKYGEDLWLLDPATGKVKKTLAVPESTRDIAVSPDGTRLIARVSTETSVFALPSMKLLAAHEHYCNMNQIAVSADGKWFAVNGMEVHVYDLATAKHVTSFEPPESPWALAFTPANLVVTGDDNALVELREPKSGKKSRSADGAPERKRKPTITALAASAKHVAVGREDGTVALFDAKLSLVRTFDGHDVTQPETGACNLGSVRFSADGKRLYVSANLKKQPAGVSVYTL